jgi:hypothetical protein
MHFLGAFLKIFFSEIHGPNRYCRKNCNITLYFMSDIFPPTHLIVFKISKQRDIYIVPALNSSEGGLFLLHHFSAQFLYLTTNIWHSSMESD